MLCVWAQVAFNHTIYHHTAHNRWAQTVTYCHTVFHNIAQVRLLQHALCGRGLLYTAHNGWAQEVASSHIVCIIADTATARQFFNILQMCGRRKLILAKQIVAIIIIHHLIFEGKRMARLRTPAHFYSRWASIFGFAHSSKKPRRPTL